MSTPSLPLPADPRARGPAEAWTPLERTAEMVEEELDRLRVMRPALSARIGRAGAILVTQLSCSPRTKPVRVRAGLGGRARFLVDSSGRMGAVYAVDPADWSCSCPDYHSRDGGACKHAIACYVLWRVSCHPVSYRGNP